MLVNDKKVVYIAAHVKPCVKSALPRSQMWRGERKQLIQLEFS